MIISTWYLPVLNSMMLQPSNIQLHPWYCGNASIFCYVTIINHNMSLRETIRGHLLFSSKMYSSDLGCCGCCSALRPRYKRLVDNIFPVQPQDGLVKSNMEKLTYYSLSSPEKLDRIGEYLFQKASRDIYRRRHGYNI